VDQSVRMTGGDRDTADMEKLVALMAKTGAEFRFSELVELCWEHGLFSRLLGDSDAHDVEPSNLRTQRQGPLRQTADPLRWPIVPAGPQISRPWPTQHKGFPSIRTHSRTVSRRAVFKHDRDGRDGSPKKRGSIPFRANRLPWPAARRLGIRRSRVTTAERLANSINAQAMVVRSNAKRTESHSFIRHWVLSRSRRNTSIGSPCSTAHLNERSDEP
jgi:hypothetical protein